MCPKIVRVQNDAFGMNSKQIPLVVVDEGITIDWLHGHLPRLSCMSSYQISYGVGSHNNFRSTDLNHGRLAPSKRAHQDADPFPNPNLHVLTQDGQSIRHQSRYEDRG